MPCSGENCKSELIENVKYNLCPNCNSVRLTGKTKAERQRESVIKSRDRVASPKRISDRGLFVRTPSAIIPTTKIWVPIRQQTTKDAGIKAKLSVVKKEIELEAIQNNEYYCRGCGNSHPGLDKSHLLSVGQFKHLELVKANIQLMCRDCHLTWESGSIDLQMALNCFIDNMIFIASQDRESYQKFITRIETYLENLSWLENEQFDRLGDMYQLIITKCG